jgi:homoserine O-succinyltransferase
MPHARRHASVRSVRPSVRRPLEIALVNNMPDTALLATERQFGGLLAEAAGEAFDVKLRLYALAEVPRSELARAAMQDRYAGIDCLEAIGADGLIVTGAEPKAADLRDEPYWRELASLVDWARESTRSALFSCLAAHAAALRLDGIERRRLPAKASGVFAFDLVTKSPLTRGLRQPLRMPHSRYNDLPLETLTDHGYQILSHSPVAGVDICTRPDKSLLVFLQGHPEYDADSLLREYRRDLGRFLRGERSSPPRPSGYFDPATERALDALAQQALASGEAVRMSGCDEIAAAFRPAAPWRTQAVRLYRNWLALMAAAKAAEEDTVGRARRVELAEQSSGQIGQTR